MLTKGLGIFALALLLLSSVAIADITTVPENANGNDFFLSEIVYCREESIDIGDSSNDGCTLAIEKHQVVSVWNNSKIESGTVDVTELGVFGGGDFTCTASRPCTVDYYRSSTDESFNGIGGAIKIWSHPPTVNNACQMNYTQGLTSADDLFCMPVENLTGVSGTTQRYELTNTWRTSEVERVKLNFVAKTCDGVQSTSNFILGDTVLGKTRIYSGSLDDVVAGGFIVNVSFPSDNIFKLISNDTNPQYSNYSYIIDMEDLGVSTFSANNDIIVNIGFGTKYQNEANNTCVVIDEVQLTEVEEDITDTEFDRYVANMSDPVQFIGAPCHGAGSGTCQDPDGSNFVAGSHSFSTSRRSDGVLLGKSVITNGGSAVGGFPLIDINYLDGQQLQIPNHVMNLSHGGLDPNDGSCTTCVLEYIFPMPNATWIDNIDIDPPGTIAYVFQPRDLDDGTTTDSVNENKEWMDTRLGHFTSITDDGEVQNGQSGWLDGSGSPLVNLYPLIMRNFEINAETGVMSFDYHNFNYMQDASSPPTVTVTFRAEDGNTGNFLLSDTHVITFTNNQQTGTETEAGFGGLDIGDKMQVTWTSPANSEYTEVGMPDYNATLEVNFTVSEETFETPECDTSFCFDDDNDGDNDDLKVFTQIATGICQETVIQNEESCTDVIEEAEGTGSLAGTGDSLEDFIQNVRDSFNPGLLFAIWIIVSIAAGLGVNRAYGEDRTGGKKVTLAAIYIVLVLGAHPDIGMVQGIWAAIVVLGGIFGVAKFLYPQSSVAPAPQSEEGS